jgi:hypothetical protein
MNIEIKKEIIKSEYSLKLLKETLRSYEMTYGTYPPSYTTNEDLSYILNWKVLTLHFADYNNCFLKIVNNIIDKKEVGKIYGNIPERYFDIHRAFEKKV